MPGRFADRNQIVDRTLSPLKNDPRRVAAARELRDRYLEQFNAGQVVGTGKYDVARPWPPLVVQLRLPQAA